MFTLGKNKKKMFRFKVDGSVFQLQMTHQRISIISNVGHSETHMPYNRSWHLGQTFRDVKRCTHKIISLYMRWSMPEMSMFSLYFLLSVRIYNILWSNWQPRSEAKRKPYSPICWPKITFLVSSFWQVSLLYYFRYITTPDSLLSVPLSTTSRPQFESLPPFFCWSSFPKKKYIPNNISRFLPCDVLLFSLLQPLL
jgi:hypothetical protein